MQQALPLEDEGTPDGDDMFDAQHTVDRLNCRWGRIWPYFGAPPCMSLTYCEDVTSHRTSVGFRLHEGFANPTSYVDASSSGMSSNGGPGVGSDGTPGVGTNGSPGVGTNGAPGVDTNGAPGVDTNGAPGVGASGNPGGDTLHDAPCHGEDGDLNFTAQEQ